MGVDGAREKLLALGSYDQGVPLKRAREERHKASDHVVEALTRALQ